MGKKLIRKDIGLALGEFTSGYCEARAATARVLELLSSYRSGLHLAAVGCEPALAAFLRDALRETALREISSMRYSIRLWRLRRIYFDLSPARITDDR